MNVYTHLNTLLQLYVYMTDNNSMYECMYVYDIYKKIYAFII